MNHHTLEQKICFIIHNRSLYNTVEKLKYILDTCKITIKDFDIDIKPWFSNNNWWDDKNFIYCLDSLGIDCKKTIRLKITKII